ncbi:hypothetical protein HS125_05050 [bacterium]|nr:hypothetical protein [bacterium]
MAVALPVWSLSTPTAQTDWTGRPMTDSSDAGTTLAEVVFWPVALLLLLSVAAVVLYHKAAAAPILIRRHRGGPRRKHAATPAHHAPVGR